MSRLAFHPAHPGWGRLLDALRANERTEGDPPALSGLDDLDPEVVAELLPARARDTPRTEAQ